MNNQLIEKLRAFLKSPDYGQIGNGVLYEMCEKYPDHKDISEIIGKVWLIGRSYAASIERNKKRKENVSDDFYIEKVAPMFINKFDDLLLDVKKLRCLTQENISIVLKTHKNVISFIKELTGDSKRSFVSKYLHFHFPHLFFIYDSRVASVINETIKAIGHSSKELCGDFKNGVKDDYDKPYAEFFIKCFDFMEFCKSKGISLTIREVDRFLVEEANQKIRNHKTL